MSEDIMAEKDILVLYNDDGKTCTRCGRHLALYNFYRKRSAGDTFQDWCKECQADYAKERRAMRALNRKAASEKTVAEIVKDIPECSGKTLRDYRKVLSAAVSLIDSRLSGKKH